MSMHDDFAKKILSDPNSIRAYVYTFNLEENDLKCLTGLVNLGLMTDGKGVFLSTNGEYCFTVHCRPGRKLRDVVWFEQPEPQKALAVIKESYQRHILDNENWIHLFRRGISRIEEIESDFNNYEYEME